MKQIRQILAAPIWLLIIALVWLVLIPLSVIGSLVEGK